MYSTSHEWYIFCIQQAGKFFRGKNAHHSGVLDIYRFGCKMEFSGLWMIPIHLYIVYIVSANFAVTIGCIQNIQLTDLLHYII